MELPRENILEVRALHKAFGGVVAIGHVSFDVHEREIVGVIGPNGAGKTTLFNLITGFLPPYQGDIFFRGKSLRRKTAHSIASLGIARTFQNLQVFTNMSVVENVMTGRHLRSRGGIFGTAFRMPYSRREEMHIFEAAMANLDRVGLREEALAPPLSLPYGKQKLVEIARALATEPTLLLIDEPAGGLATHEIEQLGRLISEIRGRGITCLLVEHRMELVMGIADRVIVLNFGMKIAEGSTEEIQSNERVIAAYLGEKF